MFCHDRTPSWYAIPPTLTSPVHSMVKIWYPLLVNSLKKIPTPSDTVAAFHFKAPAKPKSSVCKYTHVFKHSEKEKEYLRKYFREKRDN